MDTSGGPVKLVVKAPNQQFEDQTIECEPQWTIKRLKMHLSEVYPCQPTLDEQKLIYSGQLLKDQVIIKDILRHYDGPQPQFHTFHLVYTPKNRQPIQKTTVKQANTNSDGLRQRNVPVNQNTEIHSQTTPIVPNTIPTVASSTAGNCPISGSVGNMPAYGIPQPPNQYIMAQQMAMQNWMQQAYIQYMNQYMNLLSIGVRPETVFMQHQAQPQMPYLPQNLPFSTPNLIPNLPHSMLPQQAAATAADAQVPVGGGGGDTQNPAVAAMQQQPQPAQQAQPRFPNLVQDDPQENRDWLDLFYSMIRVMVLLTLIYFYSTPLRCLAVVFIGMTIYFYTSGWFRRQPLLVREANNNNVAAAVENIQQQQQHDQNANGGAQPDENENAAGVQNDQPAAGVAATPEGFTPNPIGGDGGEVASSTVPEASEANGTSVIAFVRTFVVSFFVSLLPETPAL